MTDIQSRVHIDDDEKQQVLDAVAKLVEENPVSVQMVIDTLPALAELSQRGWHLPSMIYKINVMEEVIAND